MRGEAYLRFIDESINDFEIFCANREANITRILVKWILSVSINVFFEKSFEWLFNYLDESFSLSHCDCSIENQISQDTSGYLFSLSSILIISTVHCREKHRISPFSEASRERTKTPRNDPTKKTVLVDLWYLDLALEAGFSDIPLSRSSRHKIRHRAAYVE